MNDRKILAISTALVSILLMILLALAAFNVERQWALYGKMHEVEKALHEVDLELERLQEKQDGNDGLR